MATRVDMTEDAWSMRLLRVSLSLHLGRKHVDHVRLKPGHTLCTAARG
jgi:hypothetical protein